MNVPPSRKAKVYIVTQCPEAFEGSEKFFARLASASETCVADSYSQDGAVQIITADASVYIPMADMVDFEAERRRLEGELTKTEGEIRRCQGKLGNESFVAKAPEAVVAAEREKLEKYKAQLAGIQDAIAALT